MGNSAILFNRNVHNFNIDLPVFYQFNNTFADLEKSDFIFLIGTFPRFEGSVLNMRIRKHFFNKEVCVGYIGEYNNFTYPITHLGISTKTLLQIVEGTHLFCKKLRTFKNPLIIYGSSLGFRVDGKILQNLIKFLSKKLFLNLQNSINLNCLHSNFMQTHFCELGVVLNAKNFLYKLSLDKNFLERHTHFLLTHGNTNINAASGNVICALNTHLNSNSSFKSKFTLPINTSTERDSLCINTQGFVQKAFKSTSSSKLSRNSEDFFKTLIKLHGKPADLVNFMSKTLQKELPFLQNLNKMRIKFKFNFFKIQALPQKIYFSTLTQSISNFYMTDVICNNSKTMSECSLHLKTKTNYF